jgi:histidinol phosphatase-like enzyme
LHAPDPRTPLKTSVRALEQLRRSGMVAAIGLCNVGVAQLEEATAIAEISAVQVAVSPFDDDALYSGLVRHCIERSIRVIAHSPLGSPRRCKRLDKLETLRAIAEQLSAEQLSADTVDDVTAAEVALAWLCDIGVVPIPGASREQTAMSLVRATKLALDQTQRQQLDKALPGRLAREPRSARRPTDPDGEVVLLMGIQGAGKSEQAESFTGSTHGHQQLNRDKRGGRLAGLLSALDEGLAAGQRHWVVDNTYATRASRGRVIETAWSRGAAVRCVWLDTPLYEAQINAVRRLRARYGDLPGPEALKKLSKSDPHAFDPRAQFRFERELEPPADDEGFSTIERVPFIRRALQAHDRKAIIVQCEGALRQSKSGARAPVHPKDVHVLAGRKEKLRQCTEDGYLLFAISWQRALAEGTQSETSVVACFERTRQALGVDIAFSYCSHGGGAPTCWCRTPLPGLAIALIDDHKLDPAQCILVGNPPADRTLAERLGLQFVLPESFFG